MVRIPRWLLVFALPTLSVACTGPGVPDATGKDSGQTGSTDSESTDSGGSESGDTDSGGTDSDTGAIAPGIAWYDALSPMDVTPDGRTVLTQDATSLAGDVVLIDTASGVTTVVTTLGDATRDLVTGIAATGRISAFRGETIEASVWSASGGWSVLPSPYAEGCGADRGAAFDLSDDGAVVVGLMWDGCAPAAFRWTEADGVVPLAILGEPPPGSSAPPSNRASVISGDGQVSAGFAASGVLDRTPARWSATGEGLLLDPDNQDSPGEVLAIDYTGATLAGLRGNDGFVWTEAGFVDLGRVSTALLTDPVYPNAISADGRAVLGGVGSEFMSVPVAFIWTEADGMRALQPIVEDAGIAIEAGWTLTSVMAVSDDVSVIVGRAFDADLALKTFVLRLPPAAYGL